MSNTNYREEAMSDAQYMAREFFDSIVEMLMEDGKASDDLYNDYPDGDSYHHESHVDKDYTLGESADILDQLSEDEETDTGLWEGLEPRRAIAAQAAYTYGNAVYSRWRRLIEDINDDLADLLDDYTNLETIIENELEEHRESAEDDAKVTFDMDNEDPDAEFEFDESNYSPPFDEEDELSRRQALTKTAIEAKVNSIIDNFN